MADHESRTSEERKLEDGKLVAISNVRRCMTLLKECRDKLDKLQPIRNNIDQTYIWCEEIADDAKRNVPLEYMDSVKDALGPTSLQYYEFLGLMTLYQQKKIGILTIITRLKELLKEHNDLLLGFNTYLPAGFHIPIPQSARPQLSDAIFFFNTVQELLQDDDGSYLAFQNILGGYLNGNKMITTVKQEIHALFLARPEVIAVSLLFIDACAYDYSSAAPPAAKSE